MAASVAVGTLLLLTVAWYDAVVAFGFLIFGVVFSQPALPDLVFGIVILVAVLTGGGRWTLRRAPPLVVYLLGAFFVLNMLAAAWAPSLGTAVLFVTITAYLIAFGLWVTAYVDYVGASTAGDGLADDRRHRHRRLSLVALFLPFPGSNLLTYYSATRAKGLFDDPNVFGAFMSIPLGFALAELVEPRLLRWRRPWLFLVVMISGAAVLFSFSRAAWLNAFIVVATMVSVHALRREGGRQVVAMVGVGLVAAAVLVPFVLVTGSTSFLFGRAQLQSLRHRPLPWAGRELRAGADACLRDRPRAVRARGRDRGALHLSARARRGGRPRVHADRCALPRDARSWPGETSSPVARRSASRPGSCWDSGWD